MGDPVLTCVVQNPVVMTGGVVENPVVKARGVVKRPVVVARGVGGDPFVVEVDVVGGVVEAVLLRPTVRVGSR